MAEKYGTIPPKWTKEWWEYFWYYYKWHVIITAAALILVAVTIVQCASRPVYDMYVVYAGHKNYTEEQSRSIENIIAPSVSDVDGNGKTLVMFKPYMFGDRAGSEEYDYAIQTKLDLSMGDDCTFIYLFDKAQAQVQLNKSAVSDIFVPAKQWCDTEGKEVLTSQDGTGYAANLSESAVLNENGVYCEDLYIMVKQNYKDDEKNMTAFESAKAAASMLVR